MSLKSAEEYAAELRFTLREFGTVRDIALVEGGSIISRKIGQVIAETRADTLRQAAELAYRAGVSATDPRVAYQIHAAIEQRIKELEGR